MLYTGSSLTVPAVTPEQARLNRCAHIEALHQDGLEAPTYLGSPNAQQRLHWYIDGNVKVLVDSPVDEDTPVGAL
jgi:hypothetical protein